MDMRKHLIPRLATAASLITLALGMSAAHAATRLPATDDAGTFEANSAPSGGGWQELKPAARARTKTRGAAAPVPAGVETPQVAPVTVAAMPATAAATAIVSGDQTWSVTPGDVNFRQLIERLARRAGWVAGPWELDKDVPIEGSDTYQGNFKSAVRRFLASTEMTDYAIKPCFHSNNVVRVVKVTTKCDPSR